MALKFTNNASATLAANLSAGGQTVTASSLAGFPVLAAGDYTYATLASNAAPATNEIVKITAIVGAVATVVRAQQNTAAIPFVIGDTFQIRVTAGLLDEGLEEASLPDFFQSMVGDKIFIIQTGQSNPQGYEVRSVSATTDSWYNTRVWDYADRSTSPQDTSDPSASGWGWRNPNPSDTAIVNAAFAAGYFGYMGGNTGNQVYAMANEIQLATNKDVYVLSLCQGAADISFWESLVGAPDYVGFLTAFSAYILAGSTGITFEQDGPEVLTWGQSESNADPLWQSGAVYLQPAAWATRALAVFARGKTSGWIKDGYTKIFLTEPTQAANWDSATTPYRWEGCQALNRMSGDDVALVSSMGLPTGDGVTGPLSINGLGGSLGRCPTVHFTGLGNDAYGRRIADVILGRSAHKSFPNQQLYRELLPVLGGNLDVNGKSLVNGSLTYTFPAASGLLALNETVVTVVGSVLANGTAISTYNTVAHTYTAEQTFSSGLVSNGAGTNSFRAGSQAGATTQGNQSIAIGYQSGKAGQGDNGVIISATGDVLNDETNGHIHISSDAASLDYTSAAGWSVSNGAVDIFFPSSAGTLALTTDLPSVTNLLPIANTWSGLNTFTGGTAFTGPSSGANSTALAGGAATSQGDNSICIGTESGPEVGLSTVVVGPFAAQGPDCTSVSAFGYRAARHQTGNHSTAIGYLAGQGVVGTYGLGVGAVAIGSNALKKGSLDYAIGIGSRAGEAASELGPEAGSHSVCIGRRAGDLVVPSNSLVISTKGSSVNASEVGEVKISTSVAYIHYTPSAGKWTASGDLHSMGSITAEGNISTLSDERSKTQISPISNALDVINGITGIRYTDISTGERRTGVIAQAVQAVLPEAVVEDEEGRLSVAYGNLVGVLVEGIKELRSEIAALKAER